MKNFFKIFLIVELFILIVGYTAISLTNIAIRNEELELTKEKCKQQKTHITYKNCCYEESEN